MEKSRKEIIEELLKELEMEPFYPIMEKIKGELEGLLAMEDIKP